MVGIALAQGSGQAAASPLLGLLPLVIIFFIFYILLILPQQKKQKAHQKMLSELKEDDRVITIGGVYGKIVKKGNGDLTLEIANNVRVKVLKSSISKKV